MELKVWVEGIQRIVCGVTVNTTCQDVVFALAHATGKVGRFTLIERWRNNERLLAPNENPLKLLLKWGEYANDVQFILQRSEQNTQKQQQRSPQLQDTQQQQLKGETNISNSSPTNIGLKKPLGISNIQNNYNNNTIGTTAGAALLKGHEQQQHQKSAEFNITTRDLRKSFGSQDAKPLENVGIVKGVPQRLAVTTTPEIISTTYSYTNLPTQQQRISPPAHNNNNNNNNKSNENINTNDIYAQILPKNKNTHEINLTEVRSSLDCHALSESPEILFTTLGHASTTNITANSSSNENLLDIFNANFDNNGINNSPDQQQQLLYNSNNTPTISANGALVPPPYRDPPPPRNSPLQQYKSGSSNNSDSNACQNSPVCQNCNSPMMHDVAAHGAGVCSNPFINEYNDFDLDLQSTSSVVGMSEESESIFQATQYNDLLALIKFQREKISLQQSELNKYDAEIVYLENKERDQTQELESISREITKTDQIFRQGSEQLQTLQYVEEENELVKQQEKTLKSEITLLRSKLANCETELLQCKNKIRILMDDIEVEQRAISTKQKTNRQSVERDFLIEMERIQSEIDQAIHSADTSNKATENLKKEIMVIENAIAEKKRQVEQLVNEMKEVNLQSLTVTTSEEIKHLLEGSNKPGSSRRIIGSPRQLENAVPTSKNPHGVWV